MDWTSGQEVHPEDSVGEPIQPMDGFARVTTHRASPEMGWMPLLAHLRCSSDNIILIPLPPRSPELTPVENVCQYIRDNWLSNRVFASYNEIVSLSCLAMWLARQAK